MPLWKSKVNGGREHLAGSGPIHLSPDGSQNIGCVFS